MNKEEFIEHGMSTELKNVLIYSKCYLEEYKSLIEKTYKEELDEAKKCDEVDKAFNLYNVSKLVPFCFMYDYGTWIFFVTLSKPKCIIKFEDPKFNKAWTEEHLYQDREIEVMKELNISKADILDSVIVEGCRFLGNSKTTKEIESNAYSHARNSVTAQVSEYRQKECCKDKRNISSKKATKFSIENIKNHPIVTAAIIFFAGATLGHSICWWLLVKPKEYEIERLEKNVKYSLEINRDSNEKTDIFADVSKDGTILRSNEFPWKIKKTKDRDGNILYTLVGRRGDATAISVVPDYPKYTVYQSYDGMVIKFTCSEEEISNFTIKVKY